MSLNLRKTLWLLDLLDAEGNLTLTVLTAANGSYIAFKGRVPFGTDIYELSSSFFLHAFTPFLQTPPPPSDRYRALDP